MRPRLVQLAACLVALPLLAAGAAGGATQEISSTLSAEGYSIPAADGSMISRRRFIEDLRLSVWDLLPGSSDPYYRGPRLSLALELRLDTDFAVTNNESNPDIPESYSPGTRPLQMDAVIAYVSVVGVWDGALDARGGRQIRLDTIGYAAFDGLEATLHLPAGISVSPYLGYEVRGGNLLGYDELELDGVDSGGRRGLESDRYPSRIDPEPRPMFGTEIGFSPRRWLDAAAAVRVVGLSQEVADQRLGGRIDAGQGPLRAHVRAVWSPLLDRQDDLGAAAAEGTAVSEADAELRIAPVELLALTAEYHLYRPIFEADSIFNVFDLAPRRDVGGRMNVDVAKTVSFAAWGFARLADGSAGLSGEATDELLAGAGGGFGAAHRTSRRNASARVTGTREWGEDRVGVELGGGHGFLDNRIWLAARGTYWHIDDGYSPRLSGDVVGYMASVRVRLLEGAHVAAELENYYGGGSAPRFVALGLLQLDLWR
ncbi:MAG: hypothetical protein M0R80_19820 [Proteobacteria bacterium]|nr:hypothetical protein [Pseudomonadota bacterium]